jgi:cyanate permease
MTGGVPVVESWTGDTLATVTGSIPVIPHSDAGVTPPTKAPRYNPWRDRRILAIGAITLVAGLLDGAASDWLPLALVDGRGVSNEFGTLMLGLFFGAIVLVRLSGSVLLARFGRVTVLRASLVCAAAGVLIVTLLPGTPAIIIGTIAWGLGAGLCWPISISAAADNANTAVRNVAVVSAIGYTSMLLGPTAFGFIGEYTGLLRAFWLLPLFALIAVLLATASKSEGEARSSH